MRRAFLHSGFATGDENMAADVAMIEAFPGATALRLYRWEPWCVSLGANQSSDDLALERLREDGVDWTRRPTGGRAVFHAEELTYAVVAPLTPKDSAKALYKKINEALAVGLTIYDERLGFVALEDRQPDFRALYRRPLGAACFAAPAKSELKWRGKKLVGSAQRKLGEAALQHGSILCGAAHRRLPDYVKLSEDDRRRMGETLDAETVEIETVVGEATDYERLSSAIREGFERTFGGAFEETTLERNATASGRKTG